MPRNVLFRADLSALQFFTCNPNNISTTPFSLHLPRYSRSSLMCSICEYQGWFLSKAT